MDEQAEQAFKDFFPKPGPVPAVNPEDLRKMWEFMSEVQARHPGQSLSVDFRSLEPFGADANIVWYRLSMLGILKMMSEHGVIKFPWLTDDKPSDAVFSALAVVPMQGIAGGTPQQGLPVDIDELSGLIDKANNAG